MSGSSRSFRTLATATLAALLVPLLMGTGANEAAGSPADPLTKLRVSTVSGLPDRVTGGEALVRIDIPRKIPIRQVSVFLNGREITDVFQPSKAPKRLTGLVTGLAAGENELVAKSVADHPSAKLTLINHPIQGPVFSGPHEQPFRCQTEEFNIPVIGGTLGTPTDDDCSIETRVDYFYRTTDDAYAAWPADTSDYPDDLASTTTTDGREVPFIVRMEHGTVNRAVYQTAILHDPLADPRPSFSARPAGWNGAAIFTLGGGCVNGWYRQGAGTGGVTDPYMLGRGYAVMSSSLNVFGANCSDLTAAESAMMVKERFIESYGTLTHTIGFGCSGGAYQGHQITDNYPGIFDGIIVGCSFPEVGFGTVNFITDAWLLDTYFKAADTEWTTEQKRSVTGFVTYATAPNVANGARRISPTSFCGMVPEADRYHPDDNPTGVRCGVYDHAVNVYGTDPDTGFARRPLDNVGVQYGLAALNDETIDVDQFLDLNENVGGFDNDANIRPERTEGDLAAIRIAYQTGRLTNGGGGLADIPIIDHRQYTDDRPNGDIHLRYHTFSMRERLKKANGTAANHVSLQYDRGAAEHATPMIRHAIGQMNDWLINIAADETDRPQIDKIVDARPAELREGCNTRGEDPTFIAQPLNRDPDSECEQLYPSGSFPREVAGDSVAADVIKCQLKAPDRGDYVVEWTDDQWTRLKAIFPDGVCDYAKPGVEQQGLKGTWLTF